MKIFGSSMSPFVRKVLVACAEKGVAVESRPVGIGSEDEEFRAASPMGKMPALVDGDYRLADSSAILHYLEAKHPEPALIPGAAEARGRTIWFEEFADTVLSACGAKIFFNRVVAPMFLKRDGDEQVANQAVATELPPLLDYLEREVAGRQYLVGEQITIADIAIASSLANLEHANVAVDNVRHAELCRYRDALLSRPSFSSLIERERAWFRRARGEGRA